MDNSWLVTFHLHPIHTVAKYIYILALDGQSQKVLKFRSSLQYIARYLSMAVYAYDPKTYMQRQEYQELKSYPQLQSKIKASLDFVFVLKSYHPVVQNQPNRLERRLRG